MPRQAKAQRAAHVAADNAAAATIPVGSTYQSPIFGTVTLGENQGPSQECDGLDIYFVHHTGLNHGWSASTVLTAFAGTS